MIVYYKLAAILKERGMQWKDLCGAGISVNMPARFSQNRTVNTETIDKICSFLNVQPGDIMERVDDEKQAAKAKLTTQIESLQKQLENFE